MGQKPHYVQFPENVRCDEASERALYCLPRTMAALCHGLLWSKSGCVSSSSTGLKQIHTLSVQGNYELRIDLEDFENSTAYAQYGTFGVGLFSVDPDDDGYPLTIGDYSGSAGLCAGLCESGRFCRHGFLFLVHTFVPTGVKLHCSSCSLGVK